MSIYFRNLCFILGVFCSIQNVFAQEKEYNPIFTDTFLIQNSQEGPIQELIKKNEATSLSSDLFWDVQQLKESNHIAALVIITPIILLLLIIMKFIFNIFSLSSQTRLND